jgi:hypothetical protein
MIAEKQLENDTRTGLVRKVEVISIEIQSKIKTISVTFEVNLYSNNEFVVTERTGNYVRKDNKYDLLKSSLVGQGIEGMIQTDLNLIESFETIDSDLKQDEIVVE